MLSMLLAATSLGPIDSGLAIQHSGRQTTIGFQRGAPFHQTDARVTNARTIEVEGTSVRLALWDERSGRAARSMYAIAPDGRDVARVSEGRFDIKLRYAEFDPLVRVPTVPPELGASSTNDIFIVQFQTQAMPEYRDAIERAGGIVTYFLPYQSYIVKMDPAARQRVESLPYVRWVGDYQPAYRLDPVLLRDLEAGKLPTQRYNVQVFQRGLVQKESAAQWVRAVGGTVGEIYEPGHLFEATLTPGQLRTVLHMEEVFWVDRWTPMDVDMNIARQFGGADYIESVAGYSGQGVRGQVRDTGVRQTHVAFQNPPLIVRTNSSSTSHGTSTTGIVFGDGTGNASGRGMLPNGQGIFFYYAASGSRYTQTADLLQAPYFAVFETNSTGSTQTTVYSSFSQEMDDILFRLNILICQSQSNTGNRNSRPQAWAKNIVAVGGIKHMNTLTRTDDNWTGGASIGPAADGRIKPDLAHFYDNILTTSSTSNTSYTGSFGGTSGATPITAGHFGLLYQMWAAGEFGQTITGSTVFDSRPMNMTAKCLMINTAAQWPFSGTTSDLTRVHQGWGSADVGSAYDLRNKLFVVNETDVLQNLQTKQYRLWVKPGEPAFRATMVYSDPPGTTSSTLHRINDLTLKVTAPNGTVYWGNNGLLAGNWSTAGGSPNVVDTVENVFVQNPASGVWVVEVQANELVQDARLETAGVIDADFALAVNGVTHSVLVDSMTPAPGSLLSGGVAQLPTSNNQAVGFQQTNVHDTIVSHGSVTLVGTAPSVPMSQLQFRVESRANVNGTTMQIYLHNFVTGLDDLMDSSILGTTDGATTVTVTTNPTHYVNQATGEVRAFIDMFRTSTQSDLDWNVWIDQARWFVNP